MIALAYDHMAAAPAAARPGDRPVWRGLTLRRAARGDLPAVCDLLHAAYGAPRYSVEDLRRYLSVEGAMLWLAVVRDRPIGVAGAVRYGPTARIGVVGVHPIAQGAGVARALMAHLLRLVEEAGCVRLTLDATPAAVPLYTELGFVHAGRTARLVRAALPLTTAVDPQVGLTAAVTIVTMEEKDMPEVALFDAPLFGAARPAALRACAGVDRGRAFVARDDAGRINGYLIATRRGLGPWVARTRAAAALLAAALALPYDTPPSVVLPAENTAGIALLARHGFQVERANEFMRRGGRLSGRRTAVYGQAGFALG